MKVWLNRLTMSFIVTLCLTHGRSSAQAPLVPASQPIDPTPITPLGFLIERPPVPLPKAAHPVANKCGYLCGGNREWFGCGNAYTQFEFVFGSCRTYFGEPCAPVPAHFPRLNNMLHGNGGGSKCPSCNLSE